MDEASREEDQLIVGVAHKATAQSGGPVPDVQSMARVCQYQWLREKFSIYWKEVC